MPIRLLKFSILAAGVIISFGLFLNFTDQESTAPISWITVTNHGANPLDEDDDTDAILQAGRNAKCQQLKVLFPKGTYHFQIKNDPNAKPKDHLPQVWHLTKDVFVEPSSFLSKNELLNKVPINNCDDDGNEIWGVQHNFLEYKISNIINPDRSIHKLRVGDLRRPPPPENSQTSVQSELNIIAHWWSRFGSDIISENGSCIEYRPCASPTGGSFLVGGFGKCELTRDPQTNYRRFSIYGPMDYTWEWAHQTGERALINKSCPVYSASGSIIENQFRQIKVRNDTNLGEVDYPQSYDPSRHPLLGWYRDDDPIALDWISYWLAEAGITAVTLSIPSHDQLLSSPEMKNTATSLFRGSDHFQKRLKYALWISHRRLTITPDTSGNIIAIPEWDQIMEKTAFHDEYKKNILLIKKNGVDYPVLYTSDITEGAFSGQATKTVLKYLKNKFVSAGYKGLIILANKMATEQIDSNLFIVNAPYSNMYLPNTKGVPYEQMKDLMLASYTSDQWYKRVPNILTAAHAFSPHYSEQGELFSHPNSTPEAFKDWLLKSALTLQHGQAFGKIPFDQPTLTIYNVSEWLEAGASLQPNLKDQFGYLNAVKETHEYIQAHPLRSKISLSRDKVVFDRQVSLTKSTKKILITNTGDIPARGLSIRIDQNKENFNLVNRCPESLPPGESCKVKVEFLPRTRFPLGTNAQVLIRAMNMGETRRIILRGATF